MNEIVIPYDIPIGKDKNGELVCQLDVLIDNNGNLFKLYYDPERLSFYCKGSLADLAPCPFNEDLSKYQKVTNEMPQ